MEYFVLKKGKEASTGIDLGSVIGAERIKRQDRRVFDLVGGVNCNFKAIESLGGVERRYMRLRATTAQSFEVTAYPQLVIRCSINNYE